MMDSDIGDVGGEELRGDEEGRRDMEPSV